MKRTYANFMIEVAQVLALTNETVGEKFVNFSKDAYEHNCSAIETVEIYEEQMIEGERNERA